MKNQHHENDVHRRSDAGKTRRRLMAKHTAGRTAMIVFSLFAMIARPLHADNSTWEKFIGETLSYTLIYKGLPSVKAQIRVNRREPDSLSIVWSVKTKPLFDPLFCINNRYEITIDKNGRLARVSKSIQQKNIQQQMDIRYDWNALDAHSSLPYTWDILPQCTHLLAMLYDVRLKTLASGDTLSYVLDVESQLWRLDGRVAVHSDRRGETREIVFQFRPAQSIQSRKWKTDLLTNRLARQNSQMIIRLGPPPQNVPTFISFGSGKELVEMRVGN
ncbi:MAG: DUF3108 domain-containing protein [Calditrichaeota bacterium]|nr:MAG: DUF3108 domain-containing protein [Calditrichota bacterium]